jgi:hypothetical protein
MLGVLWDLDQDRRIREAAAQAGRGSEQAISQVERLNDRIDALVLANMAMWTILRDKLGVADQELEQRVRELDLSDGKLDGKIRVGAWNCAKCNRPNSPRHAACLYCGHRNAVATPFPV